ncbi:MAG: magnesium/cobalt transporter CorA [Thermomicrobiales bacterium]|nr:magnesium/cobalt transporter CorA [Thermomicrobiales bacterium]
MITVLTFRDGAAPEVAEDIEIIDTLLREDDAIHWVAVIDPSDDDLGALQRVFGFHYLAIEATRREHARPEIDFYSDFTYLSFYGVDRTSEESIDLRMISFFIGRNYLVTVQHQPMHMFEEIRANWERSTRESGAPTVGLLVYSVLDPIVDSYFSLVDDLAEQIDALETEIFQQNSPSGLKRLFEIKKQTMEFRRVLAPERDVLNTLLRWDSPQLAQQEVIYFQDVYDHLLRVLDSVDNYRDLLGSVLDAHLSVTSNRLNQTMKTLTASSIILMGMTLVASVYGMNFKHIPELGWTFGYWWALGLMALIGASLVVVFRRIDWI